MYMVLPLYVYVLALYVFPLWGLVCFFGDWFAFLDPFIFARWKPDSFAFFYRWILYHSKFALKLVIEFIKIFCLKNSKRKIVSKWLLNLVFSLKQFHLQMGVQMAVLLRKYVTYNWIIWMVYSSQKPDQLQETFVRWRYPFPPLKSRMT